MNGYFQRVLGRLPLADVPKQADRQELPAAEASGSSNNPQVYGVDIATDSDTASTASDNDDIATDSDNASTVSDDASDSSDDSDVPPNLADIHEFINTHPMNEEYDLLDNLPVDEDCIFDQVRAKIPNHHAEILFLGEAHGVQSWAHLKYTATGESMTFYTYHLDTNEFLIVKDIGLLHLMYPYRVFQEMGYGGRNKQFLIAFIRYIYREARKLDEPLVPSTQIVLVAALKEIAVNYNKQGGGLAVPDIEKPSRFPSGSKTAAELRPAPLDISGGTPELASPLHEHIEQAQLKASTTLHTTRRKEILSLAPPPLPGKMRPAPVNEAAPGNGHTPGNGGTPGNEVAPNNENTPGNEDATPAMNPAPLADRKRPAPVAEDSDDDFKLWVEHQKLADQRQALRVKQAQLTADKAKIEQEIAQSIVDDFWLEKGQEFLKDGKPAEWVIVQGVRFGTHPRGA